MTSFTIQYKCKSKKKRLLATLAAVALNLLLGLALSGFNLNELHHPAT